MQVIKSAVDCGDGVSIEREHPSTASKPMASFIKLGNIKGEFAGAYSNSLGGFRECSALFTTGGGGDSLTDAGLGNNSFHQGSNHLTTGPVTSVADALTNAAPESYTEVEWTYLTDGAPAGLIDPEYDELTSVAPAGLVFPGLYDFASYEGTSTATCGNLLSPGFDAGRNEHRIITETFEPMAAMTSFGGFSEHVLGQQSNWDVICDVGTSVRQAAVMPSVAIV